MKRLLIAAVFTAVLPICIFAGCMESAKIVEPVISESARKDFESKLVTARANYEKSPHDSDAIIWYGRRLAYLGRYKAAISVFTEGTIKHPLDARFLRHRGHRFISIRCLDDAVKDFEAAALLIKGQADEIEPDGLPNAKNTPTSTLQSNIWYHLGLAYYLNGDFENALKAYRECEMVSKNPDMLVAATNWLYVTLRRLGRNDEAAKVIEKIPSDLELIENDGYHQMIMMYKGQLGPSDLATAKGEALQNATTLYGVGNWELINGRPKIAALYFERVLSGDQWSSFGYIAAEAEMGRLKAEIEN